MSVVVQILSHTFTKIAFKPLRTNLFYIVLLAIFLTIGSTTLVGQENKSKKKKLSVKTETKTVNKEKVKTVEIIPTSTEKALIINPDTLKKGKSILEGKVKYKAKEYARFDQKKQLLTLYDGAELYYLDYELKSGIIVMDYKKNEVYAGRLKDSTGNYIKYPKFTQGTNVIEPDSIRFNYKTEKALVYNSRTTQQEMIVTSEISKKENDSVYFLKNARFTTAKDTDDPEYYFITSKAKFVPGKKVVVGGTNMVIYGVPTPLFLPFAFFPITEKSRSGIIIPSYGQSNLRGYSLQNGGYYFALSDNYDLAVLGDYYTNGSYALRFESSYAKKYKFNGAVSLRFENLINSERGFPDYNKSKIYNIQWSHSKDGKSNPNSRFSASVNLGSSQYFQQSINQLNLTSAINNTLNSSVSYSKTFNTIPQVNMALSATHSQNTQTKQINMTLPTLTASVDRIFPFAPKDGVKKGFFKNINLQYNIRGENQFTTTDSLFFKKEMFENAKTGFAHSIPLSTNFKLFNYFSATTSINYNEVWTLQTIKRTGDFQANKPIDTRVNGFDSFRTYSFSNSLGTTIYGTYDFGEKSKIKSIRHVIRPTISHSYVPSFGKYYETYESDRKYAKATGFPVESVFTEYTRFEGSLGVPNKNYSNTLGFSLSNTFEAKVTDKDSLKTEPKKIMLLNNLNFDSSYDLATARWSTISITGGTLLLDQKMNVNFRGIVDPYEVRNSQDEITANPFRLSSANLSLGYSITSSGKEKDKEKNNRNVRNGGREDDLFGNSTELNNSLENDFKADDEEKEFTGFYNAEIPWDMTFAYTITYTNDGIQNRISSSSLMVSANTDLTPKWKIGISSGYDFVNKGVSFTQIRLNRDLLSWNMSFNWLPFGQNASWGFFIGIKSGILSDIKYDKNNQADRNSR